MQELSVLSPSVTLPKSANKGAGEEAAMWLTGSVAARVTCIRVKGLGLA